jgi:quercetin dioxygenase-like cupin family protein
MKTFHRAAAPAVFLAMLLTTPAVWTAAQASGHISVVPSELKWSDAPGIGPGAKIAVIEGDLKAAGPVTFRIKFPAKAKVAVHTHPLIEHVTVMSGTFYFGIGDKFDASKAKAYPVGSAIVIPAGMPMFAFTKDKESTIQAHGIGPWGISYLNPDDAPAKKK